MLESADIRLQIKVKNARIFRAMQRVGIERVGELSSLIGGHCASLVCELTNFKARPITKKGEWRPIALKVATALHVEPDELWPEYLREIEMKRGDVAIDVSVEQLAAVAGSEQSLLDHNEVERLLDTLPPRARKVIELRFGLNGNGVHTFREAGEIIGVTVERVRQIESKAMRRLYAPKRRFDRPPEVYGPPAPVRLDDAILDDDLYRHVDKLTKAERALIKLRFGPRSRSRELVAPVFGVTPDEIAKMETRAMDRLRLFSKGGWA